MTLTDPLSLRVTSHEKWFSIRRRALPSFRSRIFRVGSASSRPSSATGQRQNQETTQAFRIYSLRKRPGNSEKDLRLAKPLMISSLKHLLSCVKYPNEYCTMRHFDVQILGGIVLHEGKIAEMKTGEGKTLVATLPVYLNALEGKGVHVVTVNDYLAKRDTQWMGPIYHFLGLTVGVIQHDISFLYDPSYLSTDKKTGFPQALFKTGGLCSGYNLRHQ